MLNSSGSVLRSSRSAPQEAKICCLLGTIRCYLLAFVPWAWYFFFFLLVTWSCRALDLGFCAFWSIPLPRSEGGCCPAVLLSLPALCWRQSKMDKPSLLTFSYAIDCICLYEALCSPVESPDFPLASGKAWHIDFFHSLRLNAPSTRNSHETSSHRAWERKALCI